MLQFEVGMGIFLQCRPHIMAHTGVGSRLLQVVCHLFFGHSHLDTMGFEFLHTMIRYTWVFHEEATLYKVTKVARFPEPLFARRNSDAIAPQRSSRQVTFVHQKYNLLHKSCKARNMLWTGYAGYVTFQLLACVLLRRMLVSKYFGQVNYRTSVSCYTLSKVGWSFVCSVQDTCSEKKKEFGNP